MVCERGLNFVALKELVLLALGAMRAFQARNQKNRYAYRDQHGENVPVHRQPMRHIVHLGSPFPGQFRPISELVFSSM
jgi:hypothetical protein